MLGRCRQTCDKQWNRTILRSVLASRRRSSRVPHAPGRYPGVGRGDDGRPGGQPTIERAHRGDCAHLSRVGQVCKLRTHDVAGVKGPIKVAYESGGNGQAKDEAQFIYVDAETEGGNL